MIKEIYNLFESTILSEIPEIKSVDLFFNQFQTDSIGNTDSRENPRILIEIKEINPVQSFGGIQNSEVTITLHISIDIIGMFNSYHENKNINLIYLDLLETIYQKLQCITSYTLNDNLKTEGILVHQVERSRLQLATNEGSIKISQIDFRMIVEDNTLLTPVIEGTVGISGEVETINADVEF